MLCRSLKVALPYLRASYLHSRETFGPILISQQPMYSFSKNDDTPDGFEKFKRKTKKKTPSSASKEESLKNGEREEGNKEDDDPFRSFNRNKNTKNEPEEQEEENNQVDANEQKVTKPKKRWSFRVSDKKKASNQASNTSDQEEPESDKKSQSQQKQQKKEQEDKNEEEQDEQQQQQQQQQQQNQQNRQQNSKQEENADFQSRMKDFWNRGNNKNYIIGALILSMFGPAYYYKYEASKFISFSDFVKTYLDTGNVQSIVIQRQAIGTSLKTYAVVYTKDNSTKKVVLSNVDHFLEEVEKHQVEKGKEGQQVIPISFQYLVDLNKQVTNVFSWMITVAAVGFFFVYFSQIRKSIGKAGGGMDMFNMGKSNVKVFGVDSKVNTRFADVAGQDEAKQEIMEFVEFLKKPAKFKAIGAKLPRGALLTGPPGTGKTLLAKACAGEAGVPFFFISGSDFVEMFVGVGASRVRDLFKQAKQKSPSIIFIDEIDAVGRKRENKMGGNDERDNTLNQLLVEMDGFGTDASVIVLAATNRKELLDPALTRPGRFDRQIEVTNPDLDGRKQIFMVHLKPLKLHESKSMDEYARRLATLTPGFSGADIMNLCNEAAILAARKNKKAIESIDFELASERVIAGLEKKKIISEEERKIVAVHESGHAITSWFLEGGHPLLKLTIIPRTKGSLGFAQYLPNENSLETKDELLDRLCMILGGRVAEEEIFGSITTGAYDDLKRAQELCHALVTKYGMSESMGYVGFAENEYSKTYSIHTNTMIDKEIQRFISDATERARELIKKYRPQLEALSNTLLEKETLDLRQITKILGERPFTPKSNFKAYLDLQIEDEAEKQAAETASATATSTATDASLDSATSESEKSNSNENIENKSTAATNTTTEEKETTSNEKPKNE